MNICMKCCDEKSSMLFRLSADEAIVIGFAVLAPPFVTPSTLNGLHEITVSNLAIPPSTLPLSPTSASLLSSPASSSLLSSSATVQPIPQSQPQQQKQKQWKPNNNNNSSSSSSSKSTQHSFYHNCYFRHNCCPQTMVFPFKIGFLDHSLSDIQFRWKYGFVKSFSNSFQHSFEFCTAEVQVERTIVQENFRQISFVGSDYYSNCSLIIL